MIDKRIEAAIERKGKWITKEFFKDNPEGCTFAPYVNRDLLATTWEMASKWAFEVAEAMAASERMKNALDLGYWPVKDIDAQQAEARLRELLGEE